MNWRIVAARAPLVLALAGVLTVLLARSSLTTLLPFDLALATMGVWIFLGLVVVLLPALLGSGSPLPAAALVVVPALAASSYGASRLDWLRLLKDFGVAETRAFDLLRFALALLSLVLLWALHATDLALRLRSRAIERGIEPAQARAAAGRVARRTAEAAGIAIGGAVVLLGIAIAAATLARFLPVARAAFVAPLVAAALLAGVAAWLFRTGRAST